MKFQMYFFIFFPNSKIKFYFFIYKKKKKKKKEFSFISNLSARNEWRESRALESKLAKKPVDALFSTFATCRLVNGDA